MANWKITMLLQQGTGLAAGDTLATNEHVGGWTESVYDTGPDFVTVKNKLLFGVFPNVSILATRALCLANSGQLIGYRISQVLPKSGKAQTAAINYVGVSGNTDVPQMALLCTCNAQSTPNIRRFSIRGIPDIYVDRGEYKPGPPLDGYLNQYFAGLGNYSFLGLDLTAAIFDVQTITASSGVLRTTANAGTWNVGDTIKISRTEFTATGELVSFKTKIKSITTLTEFVIDPAPLLDCRGGTAQKQSYALFPMDASTMRISRVTLRKVGRPFGGYRGRRSKARTVAA